ncbi:MAG TPA: anti-sigma factor [Caulobacteraceae bacterium]|nr:anti-sigma factor [Caulobacteraceae bacterium]
MSFDETTIAAFADGELPPPMAALIQAEAAHDPALAARIDDARALRRAVADAFAAALTEPPPERLIAAVRSAPAGAEIVDLARFRRHGRRRLAVLAPRWAAAAACLGLAFAAGRWLASPLAPIAAGPRGGLVAQGALAAGLQSQLASTQPLGAPVEIGVSFRSRAGRFCRTFVMRQATPLAGLACRGRAGWRLKMLVETHRLAAPAGGYATAGDKTPIAILDAVDAMIRGRPLDAAAEARARDAGWSTK